MEDGLLRGISIQERGNETRKRVEVITRQSLYQRKNLSGSIHIRQLTDAGSLPA